LWLFTVFRLAAVGGAAQPLVGSFNSDSTTPFALPLEFCSSWSTCLFYNRDNIGHYLQKDSSPVDLTERCSRTGPPAVAGPIAILRLRDFFGIFPAGGSSVTFYLTNVR